MKLEEIISKSIFVRDGMKVSWLGETRVYHESGDPNKKVYCANNGKLAFNVGRKIYVSEMCSKNVSTLIENGYSYETFYVPFSNCEEPELAEDLIVYNRVFGIANNSKSKQKPLKELHEQNCYTYIGRFGWYDLVEDVTGIEVWMYHYKSPFRIRIGTFRAGLYDKGKILKFISAIEKTDFDLLDVAYVHLETLESYFEDLCNTLNNEGNILCLVGGKRYDGDEYMDKSFYADSDPFIQDGSNESFYYSYVYRNGVAEVWLNGSFESVSVRVRSASAGDIDEVYDYVGSDYYTRQNIGYLKSINKQYPIGALEGEFRRFMGDKGDVYFELMKAH